MKQKFNYLLLLLAVVIPFAFTNCGKDNNEEETTVQDIELSSTSVTLNQNEANKVKTVTINKGNGTYAVNVNEDGKTFVKAEVASDGKSITLTALAVGIATVNVKDAKDKTATITVTVNDIAVVLAKTGWTATAPVSGSNTNRAVSNILTDDRKVFWEPLGGPYPDLAANPRFALIDMKVAKTISKITIGRRTDVAEGTTDTKRVAIYLATEADKYPETPIAILDFGPIINKDEAKTISFTPTQAQFIKLSIIEGNPRAIGGKVYANIASVDVYGW